MTSCADPSNLPFCRSLAREVCSPNMVVQNVDTTDELKFIKGGRLNLICLRQGKEVEKVEVNPSFLNNEAVVRSTGMDAILFLPNVVFKVTLDFRKQISCIPGSIREATDWILLSTTGQSAVFNRVEERLILQHCAVSTRSNIKQLEQPINIVLSWTDDEWIVERVFR
jgi:hypothetical protein